MPNVARESTLSHEEATDDEHAFVGMYSARQAEDATNGVADIYARNPDARALYARGVRDVLTTINVFFEEGVDPEDVVQLLEKMGQQADAAMTSATH